MIIIASIALGVLVGAITTTAVFLGVDVLDFVRSLRHRKRIQRIDMPRGRVVHLEGWRRR